MFGSDLRGLSGAESLLRASGIVFARGETVLRAGARMFAGDKTVFAGIETMFAASKTMVARSETVFAEKKSMFAGMRTMFAVSETMFVGNETVFAGEKSVFVGSETMFVSVCTGVDVSGNGVGISAKKVRQNGAINGNRRLFWWAKRIRTQSGTMGMVLAQQTIGRGPLGAANEPEL